MAEGLLRHHLDAGGVDAEVASAGIMDGGVAASGPAVDVLAARGIDLAAHRSRRMAAEEIAAADLVLGMERRHVQEAVVLVPDAEARSFTLKDLVRRAELDAPRRDGEALRAWAARLAATRDRAELLGIGDDAVEDPIGRSKSHYERTAAELDELLRRLVARAFPASAAAGEHERAS
jgi:protein-tyrosine phosphatase